MKLMYNPILLLFFIGIGSIFSCNPDHKEDISDVVNFHETIIIQGCYNFHSINKFVVRDTEDYDLLKISPIIAVTCPDGILIDIDFDKYILLGHFTSGVCSAQYTRKAYWDATKNEISYNIDVKYEGLCKKLESNINWVSVPKYSEDMNIIFNISEQ